MFFEREGFFKTCLLGREERRGELSLPSFGIRGLLFLSSEAVFTWLVGESGAQDKHWLVANIGFLTRLVIV